MLKQTFYISTNKSRPYENKYGIFYNDRFERILDNGEQFSHKSKYIKLYKINKTDKYKLTNIIEYDKIISNYVKDKKTIHMIERIYDTKLSNMINLIPFLLNNGGGTELVKSCGTNILEKVILEDLPKIGLNVIEMSDEYVNNVNDNIKKNEKNNKIKYDYDILERFLMEEQKDIIFQANYREYQENIIDDGLKLLEKHNKFYLELATGSGKTYIVYRILSIIKPKLIICFSPRKKINKQNISHKYLSLLENVYEEYDFSNKKIKFDDFISSESDKIISACYQSQKALYDKLFEIHFDCNDIFIWFDESHWAIEENWIQNITESKRFWLMNDNIKYRCFTTASPNRDIISENDEIFGKLYRPIKIKELVKQKWLCPILPYIFETYEQNKVDLINYILTSFENKNYGFSFHNRDKHAYTLFKVHYELYENGKTLVKPFLLIDNTNLSEENKQFLEEINKKQILEEINKKQVAKQFLEEINKKQVAKQEENKKKNKKQINIFLNEKEFEKTKNSIAYVVKKYDMGYDFEKLDYIIFSDPKLSSKDITQCIGRGMRSDKLDGGKNKDKQLKIVLPIFIDNKKNKYSKIIEVLKYLILDIGIDVEEITINKSDVRNPKNGDVHIDYNGIDKIKAILLDLLQSSNILPKYNTKKIYNLCIKHNIENEEDYYNFRNSNKLIVLKENIYDYKNFKWKFIIKKGKYYNTLNKCNKSKTDIMRRLDKKIKKDINMYGWKILNKYDEKIPPYRNLEKYYY